MKTWKIYRHTLLVGKHTGWSYIGLTGQDFCETRWKSGKSYKQCTLFWNAIQNNGGISMWDINWKHEIIENNILTLDEANEREKYWIAYYHTWVDDTNCTGYNLLPGGDSHVVSELTRQRLRDSHLGQIITEETKQKLSKSLKGRKRPKKVYLKISKSLKGKRCQLNQLKKWKPICRIGMVLITQCLESIIQRQLKKKIV